MEVCGGPHGELVNWDDKGGPQSLGISRWLAHREREIALDRDRV